MFSRMWPGMFQSSQVLLVTFFCSGRRFGGDIPALPIHILKIRINHFKTVCITEFKGEISLSIFFKVVNVDGATFNDMKIDCRFGGQLFVYTLI